METGNNLLFGLIIVLLVVGLILCPPLIVAILVILFIYNSIKSQKAEQAKNEELRRWRQERRINANLDAMNKRIARKEEAKRKKL